MRHRVVRNKLASDVEHMKSLLKNLASTLIVHEKIETTLAKAKALRPYVEKLISNTGKAIKSGDKIKRFNAVKELNTKLHVNGAIKKLLEDVAIRFAGIPGGYTRIVKIGNRAGDRAEMARIELTKSAEKKTKAVVRAKKAKVEKENE